MRRLLAILSLLSLLLTSAFGERIHSFNIVGATKDSQKIVLKPKDFEKVSAIEYKIYDPYHEKEISYIGIELKDLVAKYGDVDVKKIKMRAVDGYVAEFKKDEWTKERIVLAYKADGKFMDTKNYGPIKIIYPDYAIENKNDKSLFVKWIWMIKDIEFVK